MSQNDAETRKSGVEGGIQQADLDSVKIPIQIPEVRFVAIMPKNLKIRVLIADESIS